MALTLTHPATPNTILLKTNDLGGTHYEEFTAGGAITPGHLIQRTTGDGAVVHSVAGGPAELIFALELGFAADIPANPGTTVTVKGGGVDEAYASTDLVRAVLPARGDEIWCLVAAGAAAVVETDYLASAGDGTVKKAATAAGSPFTADFRLLKPLEALDNSGGGTPARIRARVL